MQVLAAIIVIFNVRDASCHVSHRQLNFRRRCTLLLDSILMQARLLLWALKLLHHSLKVEIDFSLMRFNPSQLLLNGLDIETFQELSTLLSVAALSAARGLSAIQVAESFLVEKIELGLLFRLLLSTEGRCLLVV